MKDDDPLMTIARRVDPVPPDAFRDLAHSREGRRTLESILSADRAAGPARAPGTRWIKRIGAVAVAAAAVAGLLVLRSPDPSPRSPGTRWAAALVEVAEEAPRLLVGAEGWRITSADEFEGSHGEIWFENGRSCQDADAADGCYWVSLAWYPVEYFDQYLADRRRDAARSWKITIAGQEAVVVRHDYQPPAATFYALWVDGEHWLELRSDVIPTFDEFRAVADSVQVVDVDTWLSAMPASLVTPDERREAVDEVLADIPIPSNVDVEALRSASRVSSSVEDEVVGAVVCGWVRQWHDAQRSGDEASARQAVDALAGARDWKVFSGLGGGGYVTDVADAMATGAPITPGSDVPVGAQYLRLLGCPKA